LYGVPHRLRDVCAGSRRALLPLVFERATNERGTERVGIRRRVCHHEVLAPRLTNEPRVCAVAIDVLANLPPHALEHLGRAREVDAGEVTMTQDLVGNLGCV